MRDLVPVLAVVLLLTAPVAGCLGGDGPDTGSDDGGDGSSNPTADSPQWQTGHQWTYSASAANISETELEMIVYNITADNFRIGSVSKKQALVHAVTNVNPFIGRIQKGNLAVYEDGKPRAMYDFPLEDGKTWQTKIFVSTHGSTLTAKAHYDPSIETDAGTYEGYRVWATNDAGFNATYDYLPAIEFFSSLRVETADGVVLNELDLQGFEEQASGTGWFVRGTDLLPSSQEENYRRYRPGECGAPSGCTDSVVVNGTEDARDEDSTGPYDIVGFNLLVRIPDPQNDKAQIEITDGDGNAVYQQTFLDPQESKTNFTVVEDFAPGEWTVDVTLQGDAEVDLKMAGGWVYSGDV
jgi:hypothetical protein